MAFQVRQLLTGAEERLRERLTNRRQEHEAVAQELLRHEAVDHANLSCLLAAAAFLSDAARVPTPTVVEVDCAASHSHQPPRRIHKSIDRCRGWATRP